MAKQNQKSKAKAPVKKTVVAQETKQESVEATQVQNGSVPGESKANPEWIEKNKEENSKDFQLKKGITAGSGDVQEKESQSEESEFAHGNAEYVQPETEWIGPLMGLGIKNESASTDNDDEKVSSSEGDQVKDESQPSQGDETPNLSSVVDGVKAMLSFLDDYRTTYAQNTDGKGMTDINLAMNHFQYGLNSLKKFRDHVTEDID